ncbi:hypothetical protein BH23ACT11_BH23ACT11_31310 [soil metagenome]
MANEPRDSEPEEVFSFRRDFEFEVQRNTKGGLDSAGANARLAGVGKGP